MTYPAMSRVEKSIKTSFFTTKIYYTSLLRIIQTFCRPKIIFEISSILEGSMHYQIIIIISNKSSKAYSKISQVFSRICN
jgi:hypothetical protein